ncbi:hypothetical protein HMI54_009846 [Coelomomyces lativittatus]|nr:hypothetical protein HMI54_009846 [Coelomomyces lativittatus]
MSASSPVSSKKRHPTMPLSDNEHHKKAHLKNHNEEEQSKGKRPVVFWFRKDLRITDNTGLYRASIEAQLTANEHHETKSPTLNTMSGALLSIFVICGQQWYQHDMAPIKLDFLFRNLDDLQKELEDQYRIPLIFLQASSLQEVPSVVHRFCQEQGAQSLHYNMEYEVDESRRDEEVKKLLSKTSVQVFAHHDECVVEPQRIKSKDGKPYTVFTPFKKALYQQLKGIGSPTMTTTIDLLKGSPLPHPNSQTQFDQLQKSFKRGDLPPNHLRTDFNAFLKENRLPDVTLTGLEGYLFTFESPSFMEKARKAWPEGEREAHARLKWFSKTALARYAQTRDIPSISGTSGLSTYLALGIISARQCVLEAFTSNQNQLDSGDPSHVHWISEVAWRDFYRYILVHFPRVCMNRPFKLDTVHIEWEEETKAKLVFQKWCEGQTGYPIVDAAMRYLKETGWMNNRLRMVAASFLVKDLLVDWRWGEKYFMQHLIDGDLASNNGGWQWCASTGTDAQPYFRVFNPFLQSIKFDPDGKFIKCYVPELAEVSKEFIHEPHLLPPPVFRKLNYPKPIVDHKAARVRAIEAFKKLRPTVI